MLVYLRQRCFNNSVMDFCYPKELMTAGDHVYVYLLINHSLS